MKKYIIAIADDDPDDCDILAEAFRANHDVAILTFPNGSDLLDFLSSATGVPDLVITDYYMPILTGVDVIKTMQLQETMRDIPVVLLSTIKNEIVVGEIAALENVYYFLKPVRLIDYTLMADTITDKILPLYGKRSLQ